MYIFDNDIKYKLYLTTRGHWPLIEMIVHTYLISIIYVLQPIHTHSRFEVESALVHVCILKDDARVAVSHNYIQAFSSLL